jgi:ribosomal protein S18 acetylase RimI-like enzyme
MPHAQTPQAGLRARALGLTFRFVTDADTAFLAAVYASTRQEELALVPWSDAQKAWFVDMQFRAQHTYYQQHYAEADWLVVERDGQAIGRLYVDRWEREHRVIDIALLPEHCGHGLGTALMRDLLDEAAAAGKALTIHVEKNNLARRLYSRLGFRPIGETGVYDLLEWRAEPRQVNTAS